MALLLALALGGGGCAGDRQAAAGRPATSQNSTSGGSRADSAGPRSASATVRPRVVILGTSLTAGLGLDPSAAYPALLQRLADSAAVAVEIVNAGLSGETSAGALRRAGWVLAQPAALVVLEVGANDGLRGVDPESTAANLRRLVDTVRSRQPRTSLALVQMEAPPNLGASYTRRFHAVYGEVATARGIPLWPFLLDGVAGDPRFNQADGIHPNREGAHRVAANVWRTMQPALASLSR